MEEVAYASISRNEQLIRALTAMKLTPQESAQIKAAANNGFEGGEPLEGELRVKAEEAGIVFRCSGRLHPHIYALFKR